MYHINEKKNTQDQAGVRL